MTNYLFTHPHKLDAVVPSLFLIFNHNWWCGTHHILPVAHIVITAVLVTPSLLFSQESMLGRSWARHYYRGNLELLPLVKKSTDTPVVENKKFHMTELTDDCEVSVSKQTHWQRMALSVVPVKTGDSQIMFRGSEGTETISGQNCFHNHFEKLFAFFSQPISCKFWNIENLLVHRLHAKANM